ncbi:uncharacterized protein MYCGRDRAFT_70233 [Zymoseptoria tritici IPO323]|uniref:Uncharacterized protein n=4 Tax=Zymoseptoria tritici TaxID=1047171 RepID=F9X801_ZYMTI|nr:uncharacterized protein MYCGRDRAFT_70233 [Zymoseptoria tritici IPO323]EGP88965.1 hypothetical protein MYCGRDRAFT_70233 [Zymoseptoria tritici IPO323]
MARSTPTNVVDASSSSTPATPSRISKARLQRSRLANVVTRNRSRMAAEISSDVVSQEIEEEPQVVAGSSRTKGKGRALVSPDQLDLDMEIAMGLEMSDREALEDGEMMIEEPDKVDEICPILDKDEKPFPIMLLPTEIRLEIYRACLTRPYSILLSKREQPHAVDAETEVDKDYEPDHIPLPPSPSGSRRGLSIGSLCDQGDARGSRRIRLLRTHSRSGSGSSDSNRGIFPSVFNASGDRAVRQSGTRKKVYTPVSEPPRNQTQDPLLVNILRVSKEVYKEARSVIYSENIFTLDLNTAMTTLGCLHQRSRRHIKHIELEIPTYNEILERFQETVRLHIRYCSGLKTFVIHMPFTLPGADGSGTSGNTTVYANGFDILRWLPQECAIVLKGNICTEITAVVDKHLHLAKTLDKLAYARRQLISNETGPSTPR